MASTVLFTFFVSLMVLCGVAMAGRDIPASVPSTMRPALTAGYLKLNPEQVGKRHMVFRDRDVKGCLPKGYRHSSAPSRYVNYQPLGSCNPKLRDTRDTAIP